MLQGATENLVFPTPIDKRATFKIFRKAFCRTLLMTFRKEVWTDDGLPGYLYNLTDDFVNSADQNPNNECFCRKRKSCQKKGLLDLTPCYYSMYPVKLSLGWQV